MTDTGVITAMAWTIWIAGALIVIGVTFGVVFAGKRYPLLGLVLAAVLLAGLARPLPQQARR